VSQESLIARDLVSSSRDGRKIERMWLYVCRRAGGGVLVLSREEFPAAKSISRNLAASSRSVASTTPSPSSVDAPVNNAHSSLRPDWILNWEIDNSASPSIHRSSCEIPHLLLTARQNVHPSLSYLQGTDS
jgi:hypothetical protein